MEVPLPYRAASLKLAFYLGNPAFAIMQRIGILRSPVRLVGVRVTHGVLGRKE